MWIYFFSKQTLEEEGDDDVVDVAAGPEDVVVVLGRVGSPKRRAALLPTALLAWVTGSLSVHGAVWPARAYTTTRSSEGVRGLLCGARARPKLPRDPRQLIRLQTVSREIPLLTSNTWQKGGKRYFFFLLLFLKKITLKYLVNLRKYFEGKCLFWRFFCET